MEPCGVEGAGLIRLKARCMVARHQDDDLIWEGEVQVPCTVRKVEYSYAVTDDAAEIEAEEMSKRSLAVPEGLEDRSTIELRDSWQDCSHPAYLLSSNAFRGNILGPSRPAGSGATARQAIQENEVLVRFRLWDWGLREGEGIGITGSLPALGNWQIRQLLSLKEVQTPFWEAEVSVPQHAFPITYKYVVSRESGNTELEVGENRIVSLDSEPEDDSSAAPALIVQGDGTFRHERMWRGSAIAMPVFALRSRDSVGAGEFQDLKKLVTLCHQAGLRMIQLLPVNDTSVYNMWWDSYPYSSVSVFALHPLYLSLSALAPSSMPADIAKSIEEARKELDGPAVDYERTLATKLAIAHRIFQAVGQAELKSPGFQQFYKANREWLQPYGVFKFLQDLFGTAEHWHWGSLSRPNQRMLERLSSPDQPQHQTICFTYWLQWHLSKQLKSASEFARQHQIALKGDLPIGVDKRSVDTWMDPGLFHMQYSTGAPPDMFDAGGQNWGFPTYNWEEMSKDNYQWWRRRLTTLSEYFHAYRIDHILGFFRIWEIPGNCVTGLLGHFRPSYPLTRQELESHGIWDFDRLCKPYITTTILEDTFGELAAEVAAKYLTEYEKGRYRLKEEYASESAIEAVQPKPGSPAWLVEEIEAVRRGLMDLLHNVVLLRCPDSDKEFTPRFNLMATTSYANLDMHWKGHLKHLHDDYLESRQLELWREHAHKTLPVLMRATSMLVCGEDLGFLAPCVHPLMKELGLIGLRIQRMPSEPDADFGNPANYPYMCVASPSCHDTSTTRAWYEEDADRRQRFYNNALGRPGEAPEQCIPEVMHDIVQQHMDSPAMWAIFPLQDLLALSDKYNGRPATEETINDPTVRKHYWRYRCHIDLETLLEDKAFILNIQRMLLESGRVSQQQLPVSRPKAALDQNGSAYEHFKPVNQTVAAPQFQPEALD
ncbi:g2802 [Coccomyxa viridis]|uniref:4-alpha-glucanotransferase n=1 Tax=Coccomyxa viridis TaxID=1274662 RepID=A0ABP1FLA5_9CHLO